MGISLQEIIGSNLGKVITDVISQFHLSPEAKAELELKMAENQAAILQAQNDLETKLTEAASANIRAEETSDDAFTKRARPGFLYICEVILAFNFIVLPFLQLVTKHPLAPLALPNDLYWLFGSVMLGYTGARTWEKFMGAPGDSNFAVKTPLGSVSSQQISK
jgi:hypothetical protein